MALGSERRRMEADERAVATLTPLLEAIEKGLDLEAIERLLGHCTAGPWRTSETDIGRELYWYFPTLVYHEESATIVANANEDHEGSPEVRANATFIALARQLVPALIEEIRRLRQAE